MPGNLTPVLLSAMDGLLNNNSIDINAEFLDELNTYANQPLVKSYREVAGGNYYYPDPVISFPVPSIQTAIQNIYSSVPYIADLYVGDNCGVSTGYLTEYLLDWSYILLATHRLQSHSNPHAKFIQTLQTFLGYESQMNNVINSTVNGADVASSTFTSMDNLSTGNLSLVSSDTVAFGEDLDKTGNFLSFKDLRNYGTPHSLVLALIRTNSIILLKDEFTAVGIDISVMSQAVVNSSVPMLMEVQGIVYSLAETITGKKLTDILLMMNVSTEGLDTLADLLNTRKIFPNSETSINGMNNGVPEPLFLSTGISAYANSLVSPYISIMPPEIAKSNLAFRNSLYQIKNIINVKPTDLAEQFQAIELNVGLDDVNAYDTPLPDDVSTSVLSAVATGQGEDGLLYVTDGVGTPCGTTHIDTLQALNDYNESIDDTSVTVIVDKIAEIAVVADAADTQYRNDNAEPVPSDISNPLWVIWEAGRVAFVEAAIAPLLVDLEDLIDQLIIDYPPSQEVTDGASNSAQQVQTEKTNLSDAIDWPSDFGPYPGGVGGLCGALWNTMSGPSAKKMVIGFTESLHSLSEKTDLHNVVEVLEKLSIANQGGDAIVASLIEGRNLNKLDNVGVKTDTKIENTPKTVNPRI